MAEPKRRTVYKAKYTGKVYNTAREAAIDNRNFLTAQRLAEQTRRIPATYIGGNTNKARATFWKQEPVMQHAVDSIANRYGIDSSALKYRLDKEGFVDGQIKVRNNPNFESYRGYDLLHTMNTISGVEHFGLDDVATLIEQGKVKPINEQWWDVNFTNEKGRQTHGAHGNTVADNIGLMAATLKYFTDEARKDNPNLSNYDANRYGLAYYNRGVSGGRKWANSGAKGYDYRRSLEDGRDKKPNGGGNSNWYEQFKANHPVITEVASYLPVVGSAMDVYEAVNNPTGGNIFNAAVSVGSDILGYRILRNMGKALKTMKGRRIYQEAIDKHNLRTGRLKPNKGGTTPASDLAAKEEALMFGYPFAQIINASVNAGINYGQQERSRMKRKDGGIHIAPSKRGTFTAAATKHDMSVQGFASKVLANKENYSPAMVKKANFAKNASKWNH